MKKFISLILSILLVFSLAIFTGCECEHDYGEWEVTTEATTSADGLQTRKCSKCGDKKEKVINKKYLLDLSVNEPTYGTVTPEGNNEISWGESVTITAQPEDIASFEGWYNGETLVSDLASYTFTMPEENVTLTAKFIYTAWLGDVADSFAGGNGSTDSPYLISNGAELAYLSSVLSNPTTAPTYKNKNFALTSNICLGGKEWKPIGPFNTSNGTNGDLVFTGNFYGQGYTISNYKITTLQNSKHTYFGLFGMVEGNIYNLHIAKAVMNLNFASTGVVRAGLLVGQVRNGGVFDCSIKGEADVRVSENYALFLGGIAGATYHSNIYRCSFEGKVSASNSYYNSMLSGPAVYVGGLVGYGGAQSPSPQTPNEIKDCYAITTSIYGSSSSGDTDVGGILGNGYEYTTNITNCYHIGTVGGGAKRYLRVGGIAGQAFITKNCYHKGNINVGGTSTSKQYALGVASVRGSYTANIYVNGIKYNGGSQDTSINSLYEVLTVLDATNYVSFFTQTMALDANVWDLTMLDFENSVYPTLKSANPIVFA
ncbi:MAG: hypothetical protein E7372_04195 [Clostridiales bacterium]|nr:hypothetical protein [Clostridiales bacterium]